MSQKVRVLCPTCKDTIWTGSLSDWDKQIANHKEPPIWFKYATLHQKVYGHQIIVQYPDKIATLTLERVDRVE